jgi:BirA family biotin operon repressor/biotin-[acetyl-CoA-carboxylase] ligase
MNTLFIGQKIIHLSETDSTNNYAARHIKENDAFDGLVIISDYQTAGKGQRSKVWESERGKNLICSIVLKPYFIDVSNQFILNKAIALAILKTAQFICPSANVKIKWPNDILIEDKKLAGILIESSIIGSHIGSIIVGVGMNVNQRNFDLVGRPPASLANELGSDIPVESVLQTVCKCLEVEYLKLKAGKLIQIDSEYQMSLWKLNEWQLIEANGKQEMMKILGVTKNGLLRTENVDGEEVEWRNGEVGFVNKN